MNKDKINISGKDYFIASSAYTQFAYKEFTNRSMLNDIQRLITLEEKMENFDSNDSKSLGLIEKANEIFLKLTYVMIREADSSQVSSFEEFLKGVGTIYDNKEWLEKIMKLSCLPLSGQL